MEPLRCLVATPRVHARARLLSLLSECGVDSVVVARDAAEAVGSMSRVEYDVAFLDADPSTEELVGNLKRGRVFLPRSVVAVVPPDQMPQVLTGDWALVANRFLSIPFTPQDVTQVLARARVESTSSRRDVALVGGGLWVDAVSKVAAVRGAPVTVASDADALLALPPAAPSSLVVIGPPLDASALFRACCALRNDPRFASAAVLVALQKRDVPLALDLHAVGVDRTLVIDGDLGRLTDEVLRIANGIRRAHIRVDLSCPVVLRTGGAARVGSAFDVGVGGLGVATWAAFPLRAPLRVELRVPDSNRTISIRSRVAWSRRNEGLVRMGLAFDPSDARQIEDLVAAA